MVEFTRNQIKERLDIDYIYKKAGVCAIFEMAVEKLEDE
jgi:hypothetical protein